MTQTPPDLIGPIMASVLECASLALERYDIPTAKNFISAGGEVPWDNCCVAEDGSNGQLWVRMVDFHPTGPFPAQERQITPCTPIMMAAQLGVGVLRCVSTVNDQGQFPSAAEMTADGLAMTMDASTILEALKCCVGPMAEDDESPVLKVGINTWLPLGAQGGCAGGEWTIWVGLGSCRCPDPVV